MPLVQSRNRRSPWPVVMVVMLALAALAAACGSGEPKGTTVTQGDGPGVARGFSAVTIDGQPFDLADYAGKPVVVNFWASWCGYCREEMSDLVAFAQAHPEVAVVGVAVNDDENAAREMLQEYGITYPTVWDPNGDVFATVESQGLPTTVFYDAALNEVHQIVGMTDLAGFEAGLQKAL